MVRTAALVSAGVALLGGVAMAQTADAVSAALANAHANYQRAKADPFADAPPTVAHGTPFRLELAPASGGRQLGPTWMYEDGTLLLMANLSFVSGTRVRRRGQSLLYIDGKMTEGEPYQGQNAMGATMPVRVEHWTHNAIEPTSLPLGRPYPGVDVSGFVGRPPQNLLLNYWVKLDLPGREARRLSQDARFVVEGVLAPTLGKEDVECADERSAPKFEHPTEITREVCWLGAEVSRMAWVDSADGRILEEWVFKGRRR